MDIFEYAGLHFQPLPIKLENEFHDLARRCASVGNNPWSDRKYSYDYDEFCKAASTVGADKANLFRCIENGFTYIPCVDVLIMDMFEYAGLHFRPLPIRLKDDFCSIMRCCVSIGIGNYPWSDRKYNYDEFYKAASIVGGGEADLFQCIENSLTYIPCANELMLYSHK